MAESVKISIKKEMISEMPVATFTGRITIVDTPEAIAAAVDELKKHQMIGFDTETRPSFQKGRINKVALLQLSTFDHCYLFRLNKIGFTDELTHILEDKDIMKIGISVHDDFNVLHRSSELNPKGFIDLQNLVKEYGIQDISLQKIYAILFGKKISKSQRLTNWEAQSLTRSQQAYAATDAWACLEIFKHLKEGSFNPLESPYIVHEEPEES